MRFRVQWQTYNHPYVTMNQSDDRLPLYHRLRDKMIEKIMQRQWQPDTAIPTEAELTKTYNVAIGTVRKAVETLVADGLLERLQGRGTFVRRPNFHASLFRFFRHQTEGAENTIPEGRILKRTLGVPPQEVATALSLTKRAKAIKLDRLRLVDGQPVLLEEIWLPYPQFSALMNIELPDFGDLLYPLYEEKCRQTVASAHETLTVELAAPEVARQLAIPVEKPVIVIDRLALGYDRQALEWRRSRGPADRFRYQIEIR